MVANAVRYVKCGTQDIGNCGCYERCSCGWWADAGKPCHNPDTTKCSTKLKYADAVREKSGK